MQRKQHTWYKMEKHRCKTDEKCGKLPGKKCRNICQTNSAPGKKNEGIVLGNDRWSVLENDGFSKLVRVCVGKLVLENNGFMVLENDRCRFVDDKISTSS